MELIGNGCPIDEPELCHVRMIDLRSRVEIASFAGPGQVSWGPDGSALFIVQPRPNLGPPQVFLIVDRTATQVQLPH
jgi:hypothetical protein